MLALSAPKIKALSAPYLRKLGIDRAALRKSRRVILRELTGRPRVTREDLTLALERENLAVGENRIGFLLMDAELDGIICSAGRDGKKFTYQLLDNAVPPSALRDRKECIGELARRYFTTRGPSGLADFAWWAGLTMAEAREGAQSNGKLLEQAKVGDKLYWFVAGMPECLTDGKSEALKKGTFFLPAFDEYAVAYKDRSLVLDPLLAQQCRSGLSPVIVHMGKIIGTWRRKTAKESGSGGLLETSLFTPIQATRQFKAASERYSAFAFPNGNA